MFTVRAVVCLSMKHSNFHRRNAMSVTVMRLPIRALCSIQPNPPSHQTLAAPAFVAAAAAACVRATVQCSASGVLRATAAHTAAFVVRVRECWLGRSVGRCCLWAVEFSSFSCVCAQVLCVRVCVWVYSDRCVKRVAREGRQSCRAAAAYGLLLPWPDRNQQFNRAGVFPVAGSRRISRLQGSVCVIACVCMCSTCVISSGSPLSRISHWIPHRIEELGT